MAIVDAEHRGPLANVASWISLVFMIMVLATKVSTKWFMVKRLQADDLVMILAMFTAVAQSIAASMQVTYGLGQPMKNVSEHDFWLWEKSLYTTEIFYILTIWLAKISAMRFLVTMTRASMRQTVVVVTTVATSLWLFIAFFTVLFQCSPPKTWDLASGSCINFLAFWTVNAVVDIITTILISLAPVYLLYNLQLSRDKKTLAMIALTPVLTTIPLTVLRLYYLNQVTPNVTFTSYKATLVTNIHTNYSIIAACSPFLKPVGNSIAIGFIANNRVRGAPRSDETSSYALPSSLTPRSFETRNKSGWRRLENSSGNMTTVVAAPLGKNKEAEFELQENLKAVENREGIFVNQTTTVMASKVRNSETGRRDPIVKDGSVDQWV